MMNKWLSEFDRHRITSNLEQRRLGQMARALEVRASFKEPPSTAQSLLYHKVQVVQLESIRHGDTNEETFRPRTVYQYPQNNDKSQQEPAELFYPDHLQHMISDNDQTYVLTLTDEMGCRRMAYCLHFKPEVTRAKEDKCWTTTNFNDSFNVPNYDDMNMPVVIAVVSFIHNPAFFNEYLFLARQYFDLDPRSFDTFVKDSHARRFPHIWDHLTLTDHIKCAKSFSLNVPLKSWNLGRKGCSDVIKELSPEMSACLIAALLGEQRVLVGGRNVVSVTRGVQTFVSLLLPLEWPHVLVPYVPDTMLNLCEAPFPYLIGVARYNLHKLKNIIVPLCEKDVRTGDYEEKKLNQENLLFIDLQTGIILPAFCQKKPFEAALDYCESVGMPKSLGTLLIEGLREAVKESDEGIADDIVQMTMVTLYARVFGHFREAFIQLGWNSDAKSRLMLMQKNPDYKLYLKYLQETSVFDGFAKQLEDEYRNRMKREPTTSYDGNEKFVEELVNSIEEIYRELKKKGRLSRMVDKVVKNLRVIRH